MWLGVPEYPRHLPAFDYIGSYAYFLTFCTFERSRLFVTHEAVRIVHEQILRATEADTFAIHAHCYMPDHAHFVVEGSRDNSDLKRCISRAKQYSGFYFKRAIGRRLWQRYGYERVLRDEEERVASIRYVIENPIRANLTKSPLDYPYWGSSISSREELLDHLRVA